MERRAASFRHPIPGLSSAADAPRRARVSIVADRSKQLGHLMHELNNEFTRQKATVGSVEEAARRMTPYLDGLAMVHRDDRGLSAALTTVRASYARLAKEP
jgi:hypothetical protein